MDDFDPLNLGGEGDKEPTSAEDRSEKPIPFDDINDDTVAASISRSPLHLGSSSPVVEQPTKPTQKPVEKIVSSPDRITGVKTFFTKLHAGAIEFLDGQITKWLAENPGVVIKRTNTVSGMLVAKKTEPTIIVTVWY